MKVIVLAFLLAAVSATPNRHATEIESAIRSGSERLVTGNIVSAIEDLSQSIKDAGLDPVNLPPLRAEYAVPVPSVFNARARHGGVRSNGLSNIVINRMNYAVLTSRLTFNIEMPETNLAVFNSEVDMNILGGNINNKLSGSLSVRNIVLGGDIRVNIGIISGISIRSIELYFSLGGIRSDLNVEIQGMNLSRQINTFLGETIPRALRIHERDINELLTIVGKEIIEASL